MESPGKANRRFISTVTGLLLVCAAFAVLDTFVFGLTDMDEGVYTSVGREMLRTGHYLTPRLAGQPWFEKPPLLYWLMAGSMKLFGPSQFAVRFPSALAFCGILVMLAVWGNRRLGSGTGTKAALIFALSPLAMLLGRMAITDMLLSFLLMAALVAMWETARRPAWSVVWGVATGLAVLTKGPVGLGLIGLQTLITWRLLRRKEGLKLRWGLTALLVALAIAIPWYLAIFLRCGQNFFNQFVVKQNLLRFAGGDTAHAAKDPFSYLLYYVLLFWLGFFPFSAVLIARSADRDKPVNAYLYRWCWLVFGFFTLCVSKLPAYIFPMFAPASLLAADALSREPDNPRRRRAGRALAIGGSAIWIAISTALAVLSTNPLAILLGVGLAVVGLSGLEIPRKPVFLAAAVLAVLVGFTFTMKSYDRMLLRPLRDLTLSVPSGSRLAVYKLRRGHPSLYFYRNGRIVMTDKESVAVDVLRTGGYCIVEDKVMPPTAAEVVKTAKMGKHTFALIRKQDHREGNGGISRGSIR